MTLKKQLQISEFKVKAKKKSKSGWISSYITSDKKSLTYLKEARVNGTFKVFLLLLVIDKVEVFFKPGQCVLYGLVAVQHRVLDVFPDSLQHR